MFKRLKEMLKQVQHDIAKFFERIKKMIYKGSTAVEDVYVGDSQISEVYKGDTLVYQSSKILYAGMSYVPAHADATQPTGWADGSGVQNAVRCITIVKKDGSAKAIPFALYGDADHLAPTDEQIEGASWFAGPYTSAYDSGVYNGSVWVPAVANGQTDGGIKWTPKDNIPQVRYFSNSTLNGYGWPVTSGGSYTNIMVENYTVTVKGGTCYIYYNNVLVKKIRAK